MLGRYFFASFPPQPSPLFPLLSACLTSKLAASCSAICPASWVLQFSQVPTRPFPVLSITHTHTHTHTYTHIHTHTNRTPEYNLNLIILRGLSLNYWTRWNSLPAALLQMNGIRSSEFVHCCVAWKAKSWFDTIGWFGALTSPGSTLTSLMAPKAF